MTREEKTRSMIMKKIFIVGKLVSNECSSISHWKV